MKVSKIAMFLMLLAITTPVYAADEHQHGTGDPAAMKTEQETTAPAMQINPDEMDTATMQMQETRMKMQAATDPAEKKNLMHMHMQQMHKGMKMMGMMGGQNAEKMSMGGHDTHNKPMTGQEMNMAPKEGHDMSKMAAGCCMKMGGEKMAMMKKMMGSCGMMDDMAMMKKKMSMMMEMMNGMMAQQEMKMQ